MIRLPDSIKAEMDLYRVQLKAGIWASVPNSYIQHHYEIATLDKQKRIDSGEWHVLESDLVPDGWGDGFRVVEITIAEKINNVWTVNVLRWHESAAWFRRGAGWIRYKEMLT